MKNTVWKNTKKKPNTPLLPAQTLQLWSKRSPLKTDSDADSLQLRSLAIRGDASVNFSLLMLCQKKSLIFWRELEGKKKKMEKESEWTSLTAFSPSLPLGKSAGTNLCSCCVELVRYFLTECFPVRKCSFAWQYLYFWKFLVFLKPYSFIFLNVQTCSVWVSPRLIVQLQTELRKLWCWAESASTCRRPITIF